jgi:hypothetical protein
MATVLAFMVGALLSGGCKESTPQKPSPAGSATTAATASTATVKPSAQEEKFLAQTRKFLETGGSANAKDDLGTTRLMGAAIDNFPAVAQLLASRGADVRLLDDSLGQTALHYCAAGDSAAVATVLLDKGVDPNARDHRGQTALHAAASCGSVELVKVLLARGADVRACDQVKQTPLHRAASGGHIEVAELLVTGGAELEAQAARDRTPLDVARIAGQAKMVAWLQSKGAHGSGGAANMPSGQKLAQVAASAPAHPAPASADIDRTKAKAVAEGFLRAIKAGDFHEADKYVLERDRAGWAVNYPVMHQRLPDRIEFSCSEPQTSNQGTFVSVQVKGCSLAPDLKFVNGQWWVVYTH